MKFQFTPQQLEAIGHAVLRLPQVKPNCFDGPRHRDICLDIKSSLYGRIKNRHDPDGSTASMQLNVAEMQVICIAISFTEIPHHLTGSARNILMEIQPKLLHS